MNINLLNSIVPQYYSIFPLVVIALFEIVVIAIEVLIFHLFWKREFKVALVKNEDGLFIGYVAIIVGNSLTFIIGMFIYLLFKGSI
jgi:uncharacterized iron-regulated membrane protein